MKRSGWSAATLWAIAGSLVLTGPATAAETVDQAGAERMEAAIRRYTGPLPFDKGIVSVTAADGAYVVEIDVKPLFTGAEKVTFESDPFTYRLTPREDGRFDATFDERISYRFTMDGPAGKEETEARIDGCTSSGIYDPAILGFPKVTMKCRDYVVKSRSPLAEIELSLKDLFIDATARDVGNGDVDIEFVETVGAFSEKVSLGAGASKTGILVNAAGADAKGTLKGLRNVPLFELLAAFVRHGDVAAMKADQANIKTLVTHALPLLGSMDMDVVLRDLTVDLPIGQVRLARFTEALAMTGFTKAASGTLSLGYEGLELPAGLPAWSRELLPKQGNIVVGVDGFDGDALARLAIDSFDANQSPPLPDSVMPGFMSLLAAGKPRLFVRPSFLGSEIAEIRAEGDMTLLTPQAGKFTVTARGVDEFTAALNRSDLSQRDKSKAGMALAFVKGLGKADAEGRLLWDIDFDVARESLVVNGQPMPLGK